MKLEIVMIALKVDEFGKWVVDKEKLPKDYHFDNIDQMSPDEEEKYLKKLRGSIDQELSYIRYDRMSPIEQKAEVERSNRGIPDYVTLESRKKSKVRRKIVKRVCTCKKKK